SRRRRRAAAPAARWEMQNSREALQAKTLTGSGSTSVAVVRASRRSIADTRHERLAACPAAGRAQSDAVEGSWRPEIRPDRNAANDCRSYRKEDIAVGARDVEPLRQDRRRYEA